MNEETIKTKRTTTKTKKQKVDRNKLNNPAQNRISEMNNGNYEMNANISDIFLVTPNIIERRKRMRRGVTIIIIVDF